MLTITLKLTGLNKSVVPNLFGTKDQFRGRQFFVVRGLRGDGFMMILIRNMQPRSSECAVHRRVHTSTRIYGHH